MARTKLANNEWSTYGRRFATGLHLYGTKKTYMFDTFQYEGRGIPFIVIGRIDRNPDPRIHIGFKEGSISQIHAMIERRGRRCFVIHDSASTNGTWVDGKQLQPGEEKVLRVGMDIRLGDTIRLIAIDEGPLVVSVRMFYEFAQRMAEMVGGHREAARRTGMGRESHRRTAMKHRTNARRKAKHTKGGAS